ncbi:hypothetical protein EDB81DRAFT_782228 [Dactylonectria macrodidyma]|uniref:RING-type domain-containing protein n=1 Tax=Dactylonectria macrodidyma TaxID=307937 RepID=A0A9P9JFW4_9HYPO|nr:hypothetical protein EDB81DRAFT_782228 [Dactylonectria macrodidyma]
MHDHECGICSRVFGSASALSQHENSRVHRPFRCNVCCDRGFQTAAALEQHARDRRPRIDERLRDGRTASRQSRHPCSDCGRFFGTAAALQQHRNDAPGHGRDGELLCARCGRTFSSVQALRQHTRDTPSHQPTIEWTRCTVCGTTFNSETEFLLHITMAPGHTAIQDMVHSQLQDEPFMQSMRSHNERRLQSFLDDWNYGAEGFFPGHYYAGSDDENGWEEHSHWVGSVDSSDLEDEGSVSPEGSEADLGPLMIPTNVVPFHTAASRNAAAPSNPAAPNNPVAPRNADVSSNLVSTATADIKDSPFGPLTLEEYLEGEKARFAALEAELRSTRESLKQSKCSMCYENSRDTVSKCGHRFCGSCVFSWQRQHPHPYHAPCPMCRKSMGKPIKLFAE